METNSSDISVGTVLGARYVIEERLGAGGMGSVYRARHTRIGRSFAIKLLHRRLTDNEKVVRRFQREAEVAGRLRHANVISVIDQGETDDGLHYLVMDLAVGRCLADLIEDGPMRTERVIGLARQLCDGLQHAHEAGLVHRDFKPENVIVERDREGNETPRIVDFGIAILRDDAGGSEHDRLTTKGLTIGTPHYMAPEQVRGAALDHRADVFSLGIVMYELLTGKLPFEGSGVEVAHANLLHATPAMGVRVPTTEYDPLLEELVQRMLAKNPAARPQSAAEVRRLLQLIERDRVAAAEQLGVLPAEPQAEPAPELELVMPPVPAQRATPSAVPSAAIDPLPRPVAGRRGIAIAAAAASCVLVAVLATALQGRHEGRAQPTAVAVMPAADHEDLGVAARDDHAREREPVIQPAIATPSYDPPAPAHPIDFASPTAAHPPAAATKPAAQPSAAEIATLYGSVGRELDALDRTKGQDATYDLWPRYRWIRINEYLASPERRAQAAELLAKLHADIVARHDS